MNQMNQSKTQGGFSLVEILVTIGIIAIVASILAIAAVVTVELSNLRR